MDERLVFSKKQEKRFPEPGEVERELEAHLGAASGAPG